MKTVLLFVACILIGIGFPLVALSSSPLNSAVETNGIPSIEAARTMIVGEWDYDIGPNPFNGRTTRDKIEDSSCGSRYKILAVRLSKANKSDAYVVEVEFTSAGGRRECGHSNEPSFGIALIPVDSVISGKATLIFWRHCNSEKDFRTALQFLQSQDPRIMNVMCSSYVSSRVDGVN